MQHCGLCNGLLENSPGKIKAPQARHPESAYIDKRAVVIKCGHMFHYFCLLKSVCISSGLVDCVSCQKRTLLSDSIILSTYSDCDPSDFSPTQSDQKSREDESLASSVRSSKQESTREPARNYKNWNGQKKMYSSNNASVFLFIKTVLFGAFLALLFLFISGKSIHKERTVDVGEYMDKVLDSSFLALKRSSIKIQDFKDEISKKDFRGDFRWTWESFKEGCYEFFHSYNNEVSFQVKKSYKGARKFFRKIRRSSRRTMTRLVPKITSAYYSSLRKVRSSFGDTLGSKFKGTRYLSDDSHDLLNWISNSWANISTVLDLEGIKKYFSLPFSKKRFSKKASGVLFIPKFAWKSFVSSSKSCIYVLKNIMTKDAFKLWAPLKTSKPKPSKARPKKPSVKLTHTPSTDWINEKASLLSSAISDLIHSAENSSEDFKKKVKPWYDESATEAQSKLSNLASSVEESSSEVKTAIMNWYEKIYSQTKSKLQKIVSPKKPSTSA